MLILSSLPVPAKAASSAVYPDISPQYISTAAGAGYLDISPQHTPISIASKISRADQPD